MYFFSSRYKTTKKDFFIEVLKYYEIKRRNINDLVPQNYYASGNKTSKRTIRFLANVTARRNCQKPEFDPPRAVNQSIKFACIQRQSGNSKQGVQGRLYNFAN